MATIKELKEQRNNALDKMDEIKKNVNANGTGSEARSLTEQETSEFRSLVNEVSAIDTQIEEIRNLKGNKVEERDMAEQNLVEQRSAIQSFIKNDKAGMEERAQYVNTTQDGSVLIPEQIADEILRKMEETSPVFEQARKYPSMEGTLKIAKENTDDQAGFVGENEEIPSIALKFGHVTLTQKRVGAAVTLTQQLLNDGAVDLLGYSANLLARRAARAVEKSIFKGEGGEKGFVGIFSDQVTDSKDLNKVKISASVTADELADITGSVNPAYLDGAAFYMSRELFNQIRKIKDGTGDFLLQSRDVNGRIGQTILGFPVYISDVLAKEDGILFGNISNAYGILIKKGFALKHVNGDTQQTLNGTQLLAFDGYMDGNLINPEALVIASTSAK
ncbi:MAG: phage major capsid protein [Staphylococcus equorum]|nr:phage major capsid protein [Staphylococcus equorum]